MLNKYHWPFLMFVIMITCLWQSLDLTAKELPSALIGKPVPHFSLPSLGKPSKMLDESIFKGKISVINVWASWCRGCSKQNDFFLNLPKTDEFQLVGLNYKDKKDSADQWLNKLGNPYTVIIFDQTGRFGMDLGVYGTPTTYIVDQTGTIRFRHFGSIDQYLWDTMFVPELNKLTTRG